LRDQIVAAGGFENESIHEYLHRGLAPLTGRHIDYSRRGFPWKDPPEFGGPLAVSASDDLGQIGPTRDILVPPPPGGVLRLPPEPLPAQPLPPPRLSPPPGGPER
ncbi:MAG TPA: hypothetical protein VFB80_18915, partial [Pirellulaceae bacterium]|nr:hypothetical protein [Pirellulaceae bacterium]